MAYISVFSKTLTKRFQQKILFTPSINKAKAISQLEWRHSSKSSWKRIKFIGSLWSFALIYNKVQTSFLSTLTHFTELVFLALGVPRSCGSNKYAQWAEAKGVFSQITVDVHLRFDCCSLFASFLTTSFPTVRAFPILSAVSYWICVTSITKWSRVRNAARRSAYPHRTVHSDLWEAMRWYRRSTITANTSQTDPHMSLGMGHCATG